MTAATVLAGRARATAAALPPLLVEARRVAATILMGVHGRKQAGPGETFWQYRPYAFGDSTQRIDWHKSARAERVFIRENEWEAANTLWLWVSPSARMGYRSHLASVAKRERALLLAMALGELAIKAHERIAALGSPLNPGHSRGALVRIAEWMLQQGTAENFPEGGRMARRAAAVLFGDFLEPPDAIGHWLGGLAARGVHGHLVQMTDPAEETIPWNGRVEFAEVAGTLRYRAGKVESLREAYVERFGRQRAAVRDIARRLGWTFATHRTDEPPVPLLLRLHGLIGGERSRVFKVAK